MTQITNIIAALFLTLPFGAVFAHEQLLLVTAESFDQPQGVLQRYTLANGVWQRYGAPLEVNLGRNGLGWGIGIQAVAHPAEDPVKREGDGRAPAGIFALGPVFGYAESVESAMPYLHTGCDLICVDDALSGRYNQLTRITPEVEIRSFEWMRRDDPLYRLGVVVAHNPEGVSSRGSCIFLHVEKSKNAPTAGCTSMPAAALHSIIGWLDPAKKPLLIQVPTESLPAVRKRFPGVGE